MLKRLINVLEVKVFSERANILKSFKISVHRCKSTHFLQERRASGRLKRISTLICSVVT